ncbi:MAG: T9SS type A sorting domain-containing protein, partial [Bacteroidota bacterium]
SSNGSNNNFFGFEAGLNNDGSGNSFFGTSAGTANTEGRDNSFFGNSAGRFNVLGEQNAYFGNFAGQNNTGSNNSFFGYQAGALSTGSNNAIFGHMAGRKNEGVFNHFFGVNAGLNNTSGNFNAFFGGNAGSNNTTGEANAFFGTQSGVANSIGFDNAFFGYESGLINSSGQSNAFFGRGSGQFNDTGNQNTFIGTQAGLSNASGGQNVYVGFQAANNNQMGSGNVFLGHQAGFNELGSNKLYIANSNTASPLIYGDFTNNSAAINGFLGVGIQNPERPIHLRNQRAIFRIDRDRADPGFAVVRYDQGFQNVWKSFYFYTLGSGVNQGKFIIADWGTDVSGPDHKARLSIDNEGDIGIGPRFENLSENASAKLHVDGTVRFENLPNESGLPLVIDPQGNVGIGSGNVQAKSQEIGELKKKIDAQDQEIQILKEELTSLKSSLSANKLTPSAQLYQNNPNPFDEATNIRMFVPETVQSATLYIYDMQGQVLQEIPFSGRGETQLEIAGRSLAAGMYIYALIADNQMVASKQMILR